jgi:hypothetical protein
MPMPRWIAAALAAVLMAAAPALAGAWPGPTWAGSFYEMNSAAGTADFLDSATIGDLDAPGSQAGALKRAAMVTVFATAQTVDESSTPYVITSTGLAFDCVMPRYKITGAFYDHAGDLLYTQNGDNTWTELRPGAPSERMQRLVCGHAAWRGAPYLHGTMADLRWRYVRGAH